MPKSNRLNRLNRLRKGGPSPPSTSSGRRPGLRLRVSADAERHLRFGHPWLFADSVREQNRPGTLGELAAIYDRRDRFLAIGLFDPDSPLRVRVLQAGKPVPLDAAWWRDRFRETIGRRDGWFDARTTGYRLIHGESDGWPGLALDRYDATLVLKLYTAAWLPRLRESVELIWEVLRGASPTREDKTSAPAAGASPSPPIPLSHRMGVDEGERLAKFQSAVEPSFERLVLRLSRNIRAVAIGSFGLREGLCISARAGEPVNWTAYISDSPTGPGAWSPLKKPPGEGTGPTTRAESRGKIVGRVPSRGDKDVFEPAANAPSVTLAPVVFRETDLRFEADVLRGQKTGFFLDQRENRRIVESLARGRDVLNAFSFTGGFSVYAARGGARSVSDLDISEHALAGSRRNFALNKHVPAVAACPQDTIQADAFEWLAGNSRKFDLVVLDPPSLAKREAERSGAIAAYYNLARAGIQRLRPGGILVAASCSAHVSDEEFFAAVRRAARHSRRTFAELRTTGHPPDHPATFTEARYLKCIYLRL